MKTIRRFILLAAAVLGTALTAESPALASPQRGAAKKLAKARQRNELTASLNILLGKGRYRFAAQRIMPTSALRQASNVDPQIYGMTIGGKKLSVRLPFVGTSHSAEFGGSGTLEFTSEDFDYTVAPRRKDGWSIKIVTRDTGAEHNQITLNVTRAGTATLTVIQPHRESQVFQGIITAVPEPSK